MPLGAAPGCFSRVLELSDLVSSKALRIRWGAMLYVCGTYCDKEKLRMGRLFEHFCLGIVSALSKMKRFRAGSCRAADQICLLRVSQLPSAGLIFTLPS